MALINYKWGWKRRDSSWLFRGDGRVYLIQKCEIAAFPQFHRKMRFFFVRLKRVLSQQQPANLFDFPRDRIICCVKYIYVLQRIKHSIKNYNY